MVDTVVINKPGDQAPEDHDQKMIEKVDAVQAAVEKAANPDPAPAPKAEKPEGIPDKFWDAEKGEVRVAELAKSYTELEAMKGQKAEEKKPEEQATETKTDEQKAAEEAVNNAGLNFDELSAEFGSNGALSEESYAKLEKAGIPKAIVDSYIAGQQALGETITTQIMAPAGGAESYQEMVKWAADNLSHEEKVAFNKAVDSGDVAQAKLAVTGLAAKFKEANPDEGKLLKGKPSGASVDAYESLAQLTADQKDPRYKKDPAFRKMVEQKLARSTIL